MKPDYNTCVNTDCVDWMKQVKKPFADLIIADPPFNINWSYDIYDDKVSDRKFLYWSFEWIHEAARLLKPNGNLLICMGDEYISDIDVMCRRELGLDRRNWMIWHYTFGQSGKLETRKGFTRSKTHILRFIKDKDFYFDPISVAVPSDRQRLYNDNRADSRGKVPNDVFVFKRIAGTHKDRFPGMSTQMPVELLEIWVQAMCPPKGIVFDPFAGSGSSLVAAKNQNRKYVGCELSPDYHARILKRLA